MWFDQRFRPFFSGWTFFRVSVSGLGFQVQRFGFKVSFQRDLHRSLKLFVKNAHTIQRELQSLRIHGSCYSNNNHVTFKIFNCSCIRHDKLLECINATFPLLIMCHLVVISRCITYLLGTVTNYETVMKLAKDLDFCTYTQIFYV